MTAEPTIRSNFLSRLNAKAVKQLRRNPGFSTFPALFSTLGVGSCSISDSLQLTDAPFEIGITQVGEAIFNRLVQSRELGLSVRRLPLQLGDSAFLPLCLLVATPYQPKQQIFQASWLQ
ncbi:hypothetical protein [Mesorhizobium loti]|uniref:hypothetical protein n=1 Tax=Rhizobium loti TaxID=381 RepID=UPI00047B8001|nr:hypothetical protein [Mesorhizobium loti]